MEETELVLLVLPQIVDSARSMTGKKPGAVAKLKERCKRQMKGKVSGPSIALSIKRRYASSL